MTKTPVVDWAIISTRYELNLFEGAYVVNMVKF
jgi:hypothetical protein